MRSIWSYAGLAVALLVAAVLIVPGFLDWSRYAGLIEAQAEALTGRDVTISGDVGIALLPSPTLTLGQMTIANAEGGSRAEMLTVEGMRAELSVGSLFRGDLIVSRLTMREPDLLFEVTPEGRSNWQFQPDGSSEAAGEGDKASTSSVIDALPPISVDEIDITGGRIGFRNLGIGSDFEVTGMEALIGASGLSGPYKARGKAMLAGETGEFVATLGEVSRDKAYPANLSVTFKKAEATFSGIVAGRGADIRFDGAMKAGAAADLSPMLGAMTAGQPVSLTAGVIASPSSISLRDVQGGAGAVTLTGQVEAHAEAAVTLAVEAAINRLDFTGFETAGLPLTVDGLVAALEDLLADAPAGTYALKADEVRLPSGRVRKVALTGEAGGDTISVTDLSAELPGGVTGSASGALSMGGEGPYFSGDMTLGGGTPRALLSWMLDGEVPAVLSRMPLESLDLTSGVFLTPQRIGLDKLDLVLDGGKVGGQFASTFAARPELDVSLTMERLALPAKDLPIAGDVVPGQSIDLGFDGIVQIKTAALDVGGLHIENVSLKAEAQGTDVSIPEFLFRSADGANGTLSGQSTAQGGQYQATLTAPDAAALAGILPLPDTAVNAIQSLSLSAQAAWPAEAAPERAAVGPDQTVALSVLGRLGNTRIVSEALYAAGPNGNADAAFEVSSALEADEWPELVRVTTAIAGIAPGTAEAAAGSGGPDDGAKQGRHIVTAAIAGTRGAPAVVAVEAATGGVSASAAGTVNFTARPVTYALDVAASSAAPADVAAAAGYRLQGIDDISVAGTLQFDGMAYDVSGMTVAVAGDKGRVDVDLSAAVTPGTDGARTAGQVSVTSRHLDLPMLGALLARTPFSSDVAAAVEDVGEGNAAATVESHWDTGLLPMDWLTAADLEISLSGGGVGLNDLRTTELDASASLEGGELMLNQLRGLAFGGEVRASGTVAARDGISLDVSVAGIGLEAGELVRALGLNDAGTGTADVDMSVSGNGLSALALVSSLKGQGKFKVTDGTLTGVDIDALSDGLMRLDDVDDFAPLADATLTSGATQFDEISGNLAMTAGVIRAPEISLKLKAGEGRSAAFADIGRMALDIETALTPAEPQGAPPVEIVVAGDFASPDRVTNAAALEAFAGRQLLEKEIEALSGADPASLRVILDQAEGTPAEVATP